MLGFRQSRQRLGTSGIAFLIALVLFPIFYFARTTSLMVLDLVALIPLGLWVSIRATRFIMRHSLWSLRNRLLFVYGLIGILPMFLILLLVGLTAYALMSELAIYLASAELDRRLANVDGMVHVLHRLSPAERRAAVPHMLEPPPSERTTEKRSPPILQFRDSSGKEQFPANSRMLQVPPGWGNVSGLIYQGGQFYAWAHVASPSDEITAIQPLSNEEIENLVPNLGDIALIDDHQSKVGKGAGDAITVKTGNEGDRRPGARATGHIPPAVSRLDIAFPFVRVRPHFHWNDPGKLHDGILMVQSRPSAVLRVFFSDSEVFRGILFGILVGTAIFFVVVELVALVIGVSLSTRITVAVNQLYEGTRRVIKGDFKHRIAERSRDQLGELASSFNRMTGNLERLVAVEKERERLQTELEIAREVQNNLYPKEAPPACGLQLTVRCDPARMVSGDYYDYQVLPRSQMAFAIGDVAGKGISAALLMATLQAALRAQTNDCSEEQGLNPATLVSKLNKQIHAHTAPEKYATFFFAIYDEITRTLTYTNAGHLSPLLIRGAQVVPLDSNGTVVGAFPFAKYDESVLKMQCGDVLICYTDGITEPENAYGEEFGTERLVDLVRRHVQDEDREVVKQVMEAVRNWTGSGELFDDMTLLLARPLGAA